MASRTRISSARRATTGSTAVVAVLRETGSEDGAEVPFVHELAHGGGNPTARGGGGRARTLASLLDVVARLEMRADDSGSS